MSSMSNRAMCECNTCRNLQNNLNICFKIYDTYKWIVNSYVLDFYVKDYWNLLPKSWKDTFEEITSNEIVFLLDYNFKMQKVFPLSIICLRQIFKKINIIRSPPFEGDISKFNHFHINVNPVESYKTSRPEKNIILDNIKLKKLFLKHLKPKKIHEVLQMAQICSKTAELSDCNVVLDFGSGLGHLSRILAFAYKIKVCSLDMQKSLLHQAEKLDTQFESFAKKYLNAEECSSLNRPVHVHMKLTSETDIRELIDKVKAVLPNESINFGIVGLHPCGDLSAILLKLFMNNSNVKFINLVGCCYMKLSTEGNFIGYPLSTYVLSMQNELSYISREMSCHAIEMYVERLKSGNIQNLKIHSYRAVLEKLVTKYYPHKCHIGLRNVKCTEHLSFSDYCCKAIDSLDICIPTFDIGSEETNENLSKWHHVVLFYSLRLMFAPLIETILLSDRFLYVAETGVNCYLLPIFEPVLSPRNHMLIAYVRSQSNKNV